MSDVGASSLSTTNGKTRSAARPSSARLIHAAIHFVAGLLIVKGTEMPWLTGGASTLGLEYAEGKLILALGVVALALAIGIALTQTSAEQLALSLLQCAVAALVLILAVHKLEDVRDLSNIIGFLALQIGRGLYVTLAGGSLLAAAALGGVGFDLWHLASNRRIPWLRSL